MENRREIQVAYFTMEIGLKSEMPTYAGGLGMLAADLMRSCRDLGVSGVCMTIGWQHGYLRQHIKPDGSQDYEDISWNKSDYLEKLPQVVSVIIEDREIKIGCWQYNLNTGGNTIPIYFLDTNLPENIPEDRDITNHLYGGGQDMRLKQEVVLGIGGIRMLRALGYNEVKKYHMNEGHCSFLTLELLKEREYSDEAVRPSCSFTTHTPVKAGHDVFEYDLAYKIVGDMLPWHIKKIAGKDKLSMTELAINMSSYTCGVSQIHGEVSRKMFPGKNIDAITNGIHHTFWASPEMASLFDKIVSGWREEPSLLRNICGSCPDEHVWEAHMAAKKRLIDMINKKSPHPFEYDHLTIATARRVVPYNRPELLYTNLERLREVCQGKVQLIHAGNAHPNDEFSMGVIKRIIERSSKLKESVRIIYLENYNPDLAKMLVSGADVWLNMPIRLYEASGTSGMKASLNGVLNLSTLDGWWMEAYGKDYEAGWRIGPLAKAIEDEEEHRKIDAEDLYTQLQYEVIPEYYYEGKKRWIRRMKNAIALIGYFNTHRCVKDYLKKAWA